MRKIFYGWWVVGGSFLLLFIAGGTRFYAFPVFLDVMVRDMGWTRAQAALASTIGTFVLGATGLLVGVSLRKVSLRLVMVCGSAMAGLGFLLLTTVTEPWQFYLYYGLVVSAGMAGIFMVPNMTAVESWFDRGKTIALSIAATGVGVGGVVMAPLAGWLISKYDWQTAFAAMAGMVMLVGIPISAVIMRTSQGRKPAFGPVEQTGKESEAKDVIIRQALRQRSFWLISTGAMLWTWAYSAALTHQVAFAVDMGIDRLAAAGAVSLLCAFSIPGRLFFGKLGDVMDKRYVMMMAASLQMAALVILLKTTSLAMLYIYSSLIGVGIGALLPIVPGLVADYFGRKHFGTIYGASSMVSTMGMVIGPVYGGWIFDATGSYSVAFLSGTIITLLAIILIYLAPKPRPY